MAKRAKKNTKGKRAAPAKLVSLKKSPDRAKKRDSKLPKDVAPAAAAPDATEVAGETEPTALARISQLEADRANLMAQVAWARGVAQEQQKALEVERMRSEKLAAELETQRLRVEQLKALSALDRLLGRHKRV